MSHSYRKRTKLLSNALIDLTAVKNRSRHLFDIFNLIVLVDYQIDRYFILIFCSYPFSKKRKIMT